MNKKYPTISEKIQIKKLVPGGQGIATLRSVSDDRYNYLVGKKGFFWNALPNEVVTKFTITKSKAKYFEAIAEEIENPSPNRIAPKDECFLSTSPWQILDYQFELTQKFELLVELFRQNQIDIKAGKINIEPVHTDNKDFFYRNKMEYALYWDLSTEKISLAFHQRGSHRKIPINRSSIEMPEIFQKAQEIVAKLNTEHQEARKYQSLLLRANQAGEISGGLFENKKPHPNFSDLSDTILGQNYSYSPNGFFQINLPVYEMALTEIKKHITTEKILDLYSGVGTIGLSVTESENTAKRELVLVESNPSAYAELEKNCARKNEESVGIPNKAVLANSEDALEYISENQTVIVDPPRAGCEKRLLEKFLEVLPEKIIYLSCNPATQIRDVKILLEKYTIEKDIPFNFFPRTPHLENLIILKK